MLPNIFTFMIICKGSLERVSSFLAEDELDGYVTRKFDKMAVSIKNKARFVYEKESGASDETKCSENHPTKEEGPFELKDIELEVQKGQLIAVIGQVASGKSSLISAILGEMHLVENDLGEMGSVNISKEQTICYVAQQAWIQNNTLKENILFGKPFNRANYDEVIRACCLETDLKQFEGGDLTEIGEKGINLSGGQKQRVSLARACYESVSIGDNKQIILLDDVLSAVDAHVGKSICERVLNSKTGILRGTTRILVTNQLNQLGDLNVDQIVLLKNGRIALKCTYDQLLEMERKGELDEYNLRLASNQEDETEEDKRAEKSEDNQNPKEEKKAKKLIENERQEVGGVAAKHYRIYFEYFGNFVAISMLVTHVLSTFISVYSREFLAQWSATKLETNDSGATLEFHKGRFRGFLVWTLLSFLTSWVANALMVMGIVNILSSIHLKLLHKIMRSPMSFFDTTPVGRILNRFSNDMESTEKVSSGLSV